MLDQSLKAQQIMDNNMNKAFECYHSANVIQKNQEHELDSLRCFVVKWLPNFHKYGHHKSFEEGIRYITINDTCKTEEDSSIWNKREMA